MNPRIDNSFMKLRQLIYFHEVIAHSFNVSAAANTLFTSQSGISRQLHELNNELGVELFRHHGKRLIGLTSVGEEIAVVVADIIRDVQRIKKIVDDDRNGECSELLIVSTRHAFGVELRAAIVRCRKECPSLCLRIDQEEPEIAYAMLRTGRSDLGFVLEPPENYADLAYFPLADWKINLVIPKDHPIGHLPVVNLDALVGYTCCACERTARSRQVIDEAFESAGLKSPIAFSMADSVDILQYVEEGVAIGLVGAASFIPDRYPSLRSIDVSHLFRSLTSGLVVSHKTRCLHLVQSFVQLIDPDLVLDCRDGVVEGYRQGANVTDAGAS